MARKRYPTDLTHAEWEVLKPLLPPWSTIYHHFRKWQDDATRERVCRTLRRAERVRQGRDPEPSAGSIDSQSVKTTESGGPLGNDAGKRVKGRKRHLLVDTLGFILKVLVTPADAQGNDGAHELLRKVRACWRGSSTCGRTRWIARWRHGSSKSWAGVWRSWPGWLARSGSQCSTADG